MTTQRLCWTVLGSASALLAGLATIWILIPLATG